MTPSLVNIRPKHLNFSRYLHLQRTVWFAFGDGELYSYPWASLKILIGKWRLDVTMCSVTPYDKSAIITQKKLFIRAIGVKHNGFKIQMNGSWVWWQGNLFGTMTPSFVVTLALHLNLLRCLHLQNMVSALLPLWARGELYSKPSESLTIFIRCWNLADMTSPMPRFSHKSAITSQKGVLN